LEKGSFTWEGQKQLWQQRPDLVYVLIQSYISKKEIELITIFIKKPVAFIRFLHHFKADYEALLHQKIANHFASFSSDIITLLRYITRTNTAYLSHLDHDEFARFFAFLQIESPTLAHSIQAGLILIEIIARLDSLPINNRSQGINQTAPKVFEKLAGKGIRISTGFQQIAFESGQNEAKIPVQKRPMAEDLATNILVKNAGVVLINPFLQPLFEEFGLLSDKKFVDKSRQIKAIQLLHYLATYQLTFEEDEIAFYKILCGLNPDEPVFSSGKLTRKEKKACQELLRDVVSHWEALKNTSPEVLQEAFLQRNGRLSLENNHYRLTVDKNSIDVLLQRLPWSIGIIKLPWIDKLIAVNWD
jgi:hypothetical protein